MDSFLCDGDDVKPKGALRVLRMLGKIASGSVDEATLLSGCDGRLCGEA